MTCLPALWLAALALATVASAEVPIAIAISRPAEADPAWRAVAEALREKHGGTAPIVAFDPAPATLSGSLVPQLAPLAPRTVAVVTRPDECPRPFVIALHRAMRSLDVDPFADARWGLVTGRTPAAALALARADGPRELRHAAGTADFPMGFFDTSVWWSEEAAHSFTMHESGKPDRAGLDGNAIGPAVAAALDGRRVDLFLTGGHGTEDGLELGFRKKAGSLGGVDRDGRTVLGVRDLDGTERPISMPGEKAFIAVGNCLMANVDDPQAFVLLAMDDAAVRQFVGYVVKTWFGRGGWGTLGRLTDPPGRLTLSEAWWLNGHAMVEELERRFPGFEPPPAALAAIEADDPDAFFAAIGPAARAKGIPDADRHDLAGLLWDRDTVSFLGDPLVPVRIARRAGGEAPTLRFEAGSVTVTFPAGGTPAGFGVVLPRRLAGTALPMTWTGLPEGVTPPATVLGDDFLIVRDAIPAADPPVTLSLKGG